jgi:hypothetical protein
MLLTQNAEPKTPPRTFLYFLRPLGSPRFGPPSSFTLFQSFSAFSALKPPGNSGHTLPRQA